MKKFLASLVLFLALACLCVVLYQDHQAQAKRDYGEALVRHTAQYLGPKGSVAHISNGMNCQNCHLDGGQKPWGNHFKSVAALYPLYRDRSGQIETVEKRINDCLQRSLNGQPLDPGSREMQAMKAYILWVGRDSPKGLPAPEKGLEPLPPLDRAASPENGKTLYQVHCVACHGGQGEGQLLLGTNEFGFPPLWGKNSFNTAAGLYRLGHMAAFVYHNMPQGRTQNGEAALSVAAAWDLAAYVNSQARPVKHFAGDWPQLNKKPKDLPFGPYADSLSESQHKYGPWLK